MPLWYHKTDSYRWINGSIREDLKPDERSVWADLLALGGLTREPRRGYIERSEGIPYRKEHILSMLNIAEELYDRAVFKCVQEGRLEILPDGTMHITNWTKYNETVTYEEKKKAKAIANQKAREARQRKDVVTDALSKAANTLNAMLRENRYLLKDNGTVINTKTGEHYNNPEILEAIQKTIENNTKDSE